MVDEIVAALEQDGVVRVPGLFAPEQLAAMQQAFDARLRQLRWNNINGYEKTEPHRHMVEDVLTLEQGFVDVAVHPTVKAVLQRYLGRYALVEARGWRSVPTKRDFHGWHGDEWYDQEVCKEIPKEVKLGFYLTDVRSGAFNYIRGTHQKHPPRRIRTADLPAVPASQIAELTGPCRHRVPLRHLRNTPAGCPDAGAATGRVLQLPRSAGSATEGGSRIISVSSTATERGLPRQPLRRGPADPGIWRQDELPARHSSNRGEPSASTAPSPGFTMPTFGCGISRYAS